MDRVEIESRVKEMISQALILLKAKILNSSNFREDLSADSLNMVELAMSAEEEFELEISDEQAEKIVTVQDLLLHSG